MDRGIGTIPERARDAVDGAVVDGSRHHEASVGRPSADGDVV
jgi:hypothetical protein